MKRLESIGNRQATYSKRKCGILKKAKELSILWDIDILLLMFSPTEKAYHIPWRTQALKKTFKKLDHSVNIHEFFRSKLLDEH